MNKPCPLAVADPDANQAGAPVAHAEQDPMQQLLQVVNQSDNAFIVGGPDTRIVYANAGFTSMFGYTLDEVLGRTVSATLSGPHTDLQVVERIKRELQQPGGGRADVLLYTKSGRPLWVSIVANPLFDDQGRFTGVVGVLADITQTKMHEVLQYKLLHAMVQELPLPELMELVCREVERIAPEVAASILQVDAEGRLHPLAAPSLPKLYSDALEGLAIGPMTGSCGTAAWRGEAVLVTDIATDPLWAPYKHLILPLGFVACWSSPITASDGRVLGTFAFYYRSQRGPDALHQRLIDVSLHLCALAMEREESRAHIHHLAYYDTLTSLPNRKMLRSQAERALADARRTQTPLAVLFLNIDRFKQVNDAQGHSAGDELLREIARRLGLGVGSRDLVGRQAGDEFVVVLQQCSNEQAAMAAERLLLAIAEPVPLAGGTVHPNASIGVALFPDDGLDFDALLNHADLAMYQAKRDGRGCLRFFNDDMNRITQERVALEDALRHALRDGGLHLHYQPQVSGAGCRSLYGVEALARWTHPRLGPVSPAQFIPLAEECGLIDELGHWALAEACRQMADWRRRGVAVPQVAVNLSARNFQNPALPTLVADLLRSHGLQPSDLALEMTESVVMDSGRSVLATIEAVHALGVKLSLDDFGTGYSSLGYLHRLPIHELKLDKSFVQDLANSAAAQALTNTVLRIGDGLRLVVVAEGVETQLQADFLIARGCPVLQGYLFARPLPAAELEPWLAARLAAAP
ncbi:diguanylate cyclase (GGDEF)-like protein/PAS domain S-box-containing protein [Rhodoferax ferrireducens]|uniref:Diguanylate cyclase (GGDEF)-like protein/PAS domain S-box-containing protein n=1 Tax=Rhodoferax ferrireducens TaxID=192843 RepID=A0ABU2C5Y5_9BURK|nr:EAL domain-containing protein [Rhodoferax ferrireducens]MDR7376747.1 diguanylate cyclase (GGDEF)-like protein/PAS domain S-box-containing protein [Rhodoferax ferrireducens]